MNTHIQIRNVDKDLHRKLKIRAAAKDMTLSSYIKAILENDAKKPTLAEWVERVAKLPPVKTSESSAEVLRRDRDSR